MKRAGSFLAIAWAVGGCASSDAPKGPADAGQAAVDGGALATLDAGPPADAAPPPQTEKEPNGGTPATDVNAMTVPGTISGAIDPANDTDVFTIAVSPGEMWEWTLAPVGADFAPHLTVFDTAAGSLNPTRLVAGKSGAPSKLEHFVLRSGTFVAAVRDARNVPTLAGKGGPTYKYTLTAATKTPNVVPVTLPGSKTGTLASLSSLDLYTLDGKAGAGFDIVIKAKRKTPPSTLDSRMSLFDLTTKKTLITNDDASGTSDSQIGGTFPSTGAYVVVVENEGTNAADLSYQIDFTPR